MAHTPTIVLMLKAPVPGLVKTRLAAEVGKEEACRVYGLLVNRLMKEIPDDAPLEVHFAPAGYGDVMRKWLGPKHAFFPQCKGDLGERLIAAGCGAFERGATSVIFLGGDCPGLTWAHIGKTYEHLAQGRAVVGPAKDGGYYLLGLPRMLDDLFRGIPWSTATVLEETIQRLRAQDLPFAVLETLEDVDDARSWKRAKANLKVE